MGKVGRFLLAGLLGLAVYYAIFGGEYSYMEVRRVRQEIAANQEELTELRRTLDSLRARVDSLQNDSATLERLAREQIGMIRDGEILYRLVEPRDSATDTLNQGGRH